MDSPLTHNFPWVTHKGVVVQFLRCLSDYYLVGYSWWFLVGCSGWFRSGTIQFYDILFCTHCLVFLLSSKWIVKVLEKLRLLENIPFHKNSHDFEESLLPNYVMW